MVTAATSIAATPTTGPDVTMTGMWVPESSGIVHATARPKDRPTRNRRKAYPRHTTSSATPWNAKIPMSSNGYPSRRVGASPVKAVTAG